MKMLSTAVLAVLLAAPYGNGVSVRGAAPLPGEAKGAALAPEQAPRDISATVMEQSLTAMLRDRANPAVAEFVKSINATLNNDMKPKVAGLQTSLQSELQKSLSGFTNCSTSLATRQDQAKSIPSKLASLSKDHQTCRKEEEGEYTAGLDCYKLETTQRALQKSTSGALADLEKSLTQRPEDWPNTCKANNGEGFDKYTARLADYFGKQLQTWKDRKAAADDAAAKLKAQEGKCDAQKAKHESKRSSCDKTQQDLDAASCGYYDSVSLSCKTYSTCHDTAAAAYKDAIASVQKQETSMRTQFESILRMECLIAAFLAADEVAAMQACQQKSYETGSAHLILTYPAAPAKLACPLPTDTAGTDAYVAANYKPLPVNAPAASCAASCCKPSTVVRTTLGREPVVTAAAVTTTATTTTTKGELVTCTFTVDNALNSLFYNGKDLTSQVTPANGFRDWGTVKKVSFNYVPGAYLVINGQDYEAGSCGSSGLGIVCTGKASGANVNSNWEALKGNSASDSRQDGSGTGWAAACTATSGFSLQGQSSYARVWGGGVFSILRFRTP